MVKRSQISIEFIVSIIMFLSMLVLVISTFLKSYIDYAGQYQTENVHLLAERSLQALVFKDAPSNWTSDPYTATDISLGANGTLNLTYVQTFGAMNYQHVRNLVGSRDFSLQINYLPSLVINPLHYQSYPAGDVMMSADVSDIDGNPVNATVYGALVSTDGDAAVAQAVYGYGRHFWTFPNATSGHRTVTIVAFDGVKYGTTDFEVDIA